MANNDEMQCPICKRHLEKQRYLHSYSGTPVYLIFGHYKWCPVVDGLTTRKFNIAIRKKEFENMQSRIDELEAENAELKLKLCSMAERV